MRWGIRRGMVVWLPIAAACGSVGVYETLEPEVAEEDPILTAQLAHEAALEEERAVAEARAPGAPESLLDRRVRQAFLRYETACASQTRPRRARCERRPMTPGETVGSVAYSIASIAGARKTGRTRRAAPRPCRNSAPRRLPPPPPPPPGPPASWTEEEVGELEALVARRVEECRR